MTRKPTGDKAMTAAERQLQHGEIVTVPEAPTTKSEREDLQRVIRGQARVMRAAAVQRSAELMADFEQQLASVYNFDQDEVWSNLMKSATERVDEARKGIAERCRELGIPAKFAPGLSLNWYGRGENASKERRAELRAVARTRIAAIEKEAIVKIERYAVEAQTKIIAFGLASTAAKAFLENLPTIESLMPPLDIAAIQRMHEARRERAHYAGLLPADPEC